MASFLRGALVEFMPTGLIPIPNIIAFQYNPESMTHTWSPTQPDTTPPGNSAQTTNPLAVQGNPGESFTFALALDAADTIADGAVSASLAEVSGVYSRLAALEMLMFPSAATTGGLLGTVTAAIGSALGAATSSGPQTTVPANTLNTVLFVWGPGRILPVRVTALTVTEKLYDAALNPTHADVQITLRALTRDELKHDTDLLAGLASTASSYTQGLREALAVANLINTAESVLGMLPI